MNILFVCTGNICRTPLAVAIARDELLHAGAMRIEVSSAGTFAIDGSGATSDARLVASEHGLSRADHRARQLTAELVEEADIVVGMERNHAEFARRLGARAPDATTLGAPVRDPYGLGLAAYRETWDLLGALIPELLSAIHERRN